MLYFIEKYYFKNIYLFMLEKELKILNINPDEIIDKLESFGAKKTFEGFIHDIYYDFPEGNEK